MGKTLKHLRFDHTYTRDDNHKFLEILAKRGFTKSKNATVHPGGLTCRFVRFRPGTNKKYNYLEFVSTSKGRRGYKMPGLSFRYERPLSELHHALENKIETKLSHRNYDWKENSRKRMPGWNFLDFKNIGLRGFLPWVTEYEDEPGVKYKFPILKHKNRAQAISEIHFDINKKGRRFFESLFGVKIKSSITLACGTIFHFKDAVGNKMKTIVINRKRAKGKKTKPGFTVKNPGKGWDVEVV